MIQEWVSALSWTGKDLSVQTTLRILSKGESPFILGKAISSLWCWGCPIVLFLLTLLTWEVAILLGVVYMLYIASIYNLTIQYTSKYPLSVSIMVRNMYFIVLHIFICLILENKGIRFRISWWPKKIVLIGFHIFLVS